MTIAKSRHFPPLKKKKKSPYAVLLVALSGTIMPGPTVLWNMCRSVVVSVL